MATTATPMGAEPTDTLSASGSFTGKVRHIKIASAYGTAIFYGDFVKLVALVLLRKPQLQLLSSLAPVGMFLLVVLTQIQLLTRKHSHSISPLQLRRTILLRMLLMILKCCSVCSLTKQSLKLAWATTSLQYSTAGSTSIGRSRNALDGIYCYNQYTSTAYR
jgi:hypothetical protein